MFFKIPIPFQNEEDWFLKYLRNITYGTVVEIS